MINFKDTAKQFSKIISCPYFGDRPIPTKSKDQSVGVAFFFATNLIIERYFNFEIGIIIFEITTWDR